MSEEVVNVSMQSEVAVVTVDSPPVNTLSREVRAGLKACFESLRGRADVKAVVLACAGKTFLSGGDMREFETGVQEPGYHEVLRLIEDSAVPVVAALYGTVMAAAWRRPLPAITASPRKGRNSACRKSPWASSPVPAARSACRAWSASIRRWT